MRNAVVLVIVVLVACGEVVKEAPDTNEPDPCVTATCECRVATQASDCGAHEICNETGPGRVCECAPAYADTGSGCTFAGAPLDPGMVDPTKWTALGMGAVIDPTAAGNLDSGEAVVNRLGMCQLGGLKQTFTMPPREVAEQFKLRVTHTAIDPMFDMFGAQLSIGIGSQWFDVPASRSVYRTDTFCLGPAAYGGPVDFRIGTFGGPNCSGTSTATLRVDRIAVEVAAPGDCPAPGTVANGDFELAADWTFDVVQGATGAITAGAGENATSGARLTQVNKCSEVTMTGKVAFPSAATVANPAIDVFWTGTPGSRLVAQIGGKNIATLNGNGTARHQRFCVPPWAIGTNNTLGFHAQRASDNGCTIALSKTYSVDNLTVVSESACSVAEDPGFERVANLTGPVSGWGLTNGYVNDNEGSTAFIFNSPPNARTGNGTLRTTGAHECVIVGENGADFAVLVPRAEGAAGPALKWFANVPVNQLKTDTKVMILPSQFNAVGQQAILPETGAYAPGTMCLAPGLIGRRITVRLTTGDTDGGGCGPANYATEFAFWDDIEVTTDPTCPAQ